MHRSAYLAITWTWLRATVGHAAQTAKAVARRPISWAGSPRVRAAPTCATSSAAATSSRPSSSRPRSYPNTGRRPEGQLHRVEGETWPLGGFFWPIYRYRGCPTSVVTLAPTPFATGRLKSRDGVSGEAGEQAGTTAAAYPRCPDDFRATGSSPA